MKRLFDIVFAFLGLFILSPILLVVAIAVYLYDFSNPFYIPLRAGRRNKPFRMLKFRSMVVNADKTGVDSTSASDSRITPVGHLIRRYKLDEILQLSNVLVGNMSFVGPRPNVLRETSLYTSEEMKLLSVRPGITDIASIVFSDEGEILNGSEDPDLSYHQLIRPTKSRLGLFYVSRSNIFLDVFLILTTILGLFSRRAALTLIVNILTFYKAPPDLIKISSRKFPLVPSPPPGACDVVTTRIFT